MNRKQQNTEHISSEPVRGYLNAWQNQLCDALEREDGASSFISDQWEQAKGEGDSRLITDGALFEKGGVNFSCVRGEKLPSAASARRPELAGARFEAIGVSLVMHPHNPYVPTAHANLRFFIAYPDAAQAVWWFGGGYDLTPYYGFEEDCRHWHRTAKAACQPFGADVYPRCKKWCDEYFFIKHRQEARGIGGLFFDDWNLWPFKTSFDFARSVGDSFLKAYLPIVKRRRALDYGQRQRDFQLHRRGRYAEFNLVWDRGTQFGLQYGGRIESILMSMPPLARWSYAWQAEDNSEEAVLARDFLPPRNWVNEA